MDALGPVVFYLGLVSVAVWMLLFGAEWNQRRFSIRSLFVATAIVALDAWILGFVLR